MTARYDIYMAGVGGQGIGLLAQVLAVAADRAGIAIRGCDTHGLAQRGGVVSSHLRLGPGCHSPLVAARSADLVIGLERHEALRAARDFLKPGGALVWYDVSWQPLDVRLGAVGPVGREEIEEECRLTGSASIRVLAEGLPDPRMQNAAVIAQLVRLGLPPGVGIEDYRAAFGDFLEGAVLERNLAILG
jgi:indolepyruvate ferredoxin oxidoreductase beta subunit